MGNPVAGRLQFLECHLETRDDGLHARVTLRDADGTRSVGSARRDVGEAAEIWCAAEAAAVALRQILGLAADALGLRDVVAFDIDGQPAVAVSLTARLDGERRRLFGLTQAEEDAGRAAALAVLAATNRFFGNG